MKRTLIASVLVLVTSMLTGCGRGTETQTTVTASTVDLSVDARKAAAIEAATRHFQETIKATFLDQGMTVRGLVHATMQKSAKATEAKAAALRPDAFDPAASSSAKLELSNGRVIYTLVSQAFDAAAAVIDEGGSRYLVGYEVEAKVTADGELADVVVTHVGEPTRAN